MDTDTSYLLKIHLLGNPKKSRKDVRCFSLEKVVDADFTNYMDLVQSIVQQYPPGYLEVPHVQYYDAELKTFPEVTSDQELMVMFSKHKEKVIEIFIAYCDPSEPYKPITEWQFEGEAQHKDDIEQELDTYLMNPLPNNEHVGVDEEGMYLKEDRVVAVPSDKGKEKTSVPLTEDEAQSGSEQEGTENEMTEDEMQKDPNHGPHVEYDKEDPPMTVGSMYPNMAEFKLALSQHAIKNEFEYNTERSGPKRLRAYCSRKEADNCPWRIHASTTADQITVMVIIYCSNVHILLLLQT